MACITHIFQNERFMWITAMGQTGGTGGRKPVDSVQKVLDSVQRDHRKEEKTSADKS